MSDKTRKSATGAGKTAASGKTAAVARKSTKAKAASAKAKTGSAPKDAPIERQVLRFDNDKGAGRSTWIALLLLLGVIGWMGSGFIIPAAETTAEPAQAEDVPPVAVAVRTSVAEAVTLYFQAEGQA